MNTSQKKSIRLITALLLVFLLFPHTAIGRDITISGYISDSLSLESLISATLFDRQSARGAVTNSAGFYSISLPEGPVELEYSYAGYTPQRCALLLTRDTTINIYLSSIKLSEVVVTGQRSDLGVRSTQMSAIEVPVQMIKQIPALAGEVDIIKAIQLMPGVQSGTEGATGLYVRGGGPDENLILLDGIPLYNINHMLGFFSVFNADAIKNVTLYKGNFPARFGSRLSSVIDVRQNDGNARAYHGSVQVGLLSSKVNVEGPIWKDHTTFNISARRTYFDLLIQPILAIAARQEDIDRQMAGYYFYDLNARISHRFSDNDRLTASFYMGDDQIYADMKFTDGSKNDPDYEISRQKLGWKWGNLLASLNWNHVFSPTTFSNMTLAYTQYRYNISIGMENEIWEDKRQEEDYAVNLGMLSSVNDLTFNYDFDYTPHYAHDVKFGASYIFHTFQPSVSSMRTRVVENINDERIDSTIAMKMGAKPIYTHEAALYIEDNWDIHRVIKLNLGLRGSLYAAGSRVYPSIEPRAGLRVLASKNWSFKASYSYMSQYIHLMSSSNITLPTDLWMPATDRIPPMKSHQVAAGIFYNLLGQVDFSVEGYYKNMTNLTEYKEGSSFFLSPTGWEEKIAVGKGWSYGVEFLAQRSIGKVTGWVGYTWSKSERLFNRDGMILNNGNVFHPKYDRRHDLSATLQYSPAKWVDLSAIFIYGTGTCGTLATQHGPNGEALVEERNNFRMPDYHRLDLGVTFHKARKHNRKGEHLVNISCYNVYNHKNPFIVYPDYTYNNGHKQMTLMQLSIFPIIPSISYTFKF